MSGISDFRIGQRVAMEQAISVEDLDRFCELSRDTSAIHSDAAAARERGFAGRVAHGALISSFVSALIGTKLPGDDGVMQSIAMNFRNPVIPPDTLTITAEVAGISVAVGQLKIRVEVVRKSDGQLVATGEVRSLVRPLPRG